MTRHQLARLLAGALSLGFFVAAGLHVYGYRPVVIQAERGVSGLGPLVSTLWLAFGAALIVLGILVGLVAAGRIAEGRWVLALTGCFPLVTVLLQLQFLGFTRWTVVFSSLAAVSLIAAIVFPTTPSPVALGRESS